MDGTRIKPARATKRSRGREGRGGGDNGDGDVRAVLNCIRQIVRLLRLTSRAAEREAGVTGAQLFVLQKLAEAGPLSVNGLADRTHTHQSSVSVVAQALVDRGLVARQRAAADARRLELSLTPAARALLRKAPGVAQDRLIQSLERLPPATVRQLARGLCRLVSESGIDGGPPPMLFEDADPLAAADASRTTGRPRGRRRSAARR